MRRAFLLWLALAPAASVARAQAPNWPDTIFPEPARDYGTVARGSKIRHQFRLVNTTNAEIHVADWRTKCGCTEVKVGARDIPPGAQTFIEATLDTTKFQGYKASGLTLIFDRPSFAAKDLDLTCFIRGDVLLNPGGVDFGNVGRSAGSSLALNLDYYGGQPDWGVLKVETITPHVKARLQELSREPGGAVRYQLVATLAPTAPNGYFKDQITLLTNDPSSPKIPVSVTANVLSAVTVSPANLILGPIRPGQIVKKDVLVRSANPFKITSIKPNKADLITSKPAESAQKFHKLTVTLTAPKQLGPYNVTVEVGTDLKGEPPAKLTAYANIVR